MDTESLHYTRSGAVKWSRSNNLDAFRINGPCYVELDGSTYFSQLCVDLNNRCFGPSVIYPNGHIIYTNPRGAYHRTTGPAVIWATGNKEYWINDIEIPADEFFLKYGVV